MENNKAPYSVGTYIWLVLNLITAVINGIGSILIILGGVAISRVTGGTANIVLGFFTLISCILCFVGICKVFKRNPVGRKNIIISIIISVFVSLSSGSSATLLGIILRVAIWYLCLENIRKNEAIKIL